MVHISIIEARLAKLGFQATRWFKPEIRELQHILMDDEQLVGCVQGRYFGGFALLVATDHRLLLVDKKIPYLSVEDIRYDMISEIDYSVQVFDATINIYTVNKQHRFSSWKHKHHLRKVTSFAQQRVMELRQYQHQGPPNATQQVATGLTSTTRQQPDYYNPEPQQLQPAHASLRDKLPSPHIPHIMGATAVNGAKSWVNPNPYTKGSLTMRTQWSRTR